MSSVFDRLPWRKDEKLFEEAGKLFTKRQYENWVIFKFGYELGDVDDIDIIFRNRYPDAILVKVRDGEVVNGLYVEFEEYSSNFKGHDPKKCDLIVCAYHDWDEEFPNEKCPLPVYKICFSKEKNILF